MKAGIIDNDLLYCILWIIEFDTLRKCQYFSNITKYTDKYSLIVSGIETIVILKIKLKYFLGV